MLNHQEMRHALHRAVIEMSLSDHCPQEPQDVRLLKGGGTAFWSWLPPHKIYVGDAIFSGKATRPGLTKEDKENYLKSFYRHEVGHARFTERDLRGTSAQLKSIGVSFSTYNLFEDARIEHLMRKDFGPFSWLKFETSPEVNKGSRAEVLFFSLVQAEGQEAALPPSTLEHPDYPEVLSFYQRALLPKTSSDLFPLLKEWVKRFGNSKDADSDLSQGSELQQNPSLAQALDDKSESVNNEKEKGSRENPPSEDRQTAEYDTEQAAQAANALSKLFESKTLRVGTASPVGARFSARHEASGREAFRRKEVKSRGRKTVELFIDCSGSMRWEPFENARALVKALSILAQRGFVSGNVVLCGGSRPEVMSLPVQESHLSKILATYPREGLELALSQRLSECSKADEVMVFTDGRLVDAPVDKKFLHTRGIFTWGLYVGGTEVVEGLLKYFDKVVCRKDLKALVDAMLTQV
jgi:hypothetical protein